MDNVENKNILMVDYVTWSVLLLIIIITIILNCQLINAARKVYAGVKTRQMQMNECNGRYFEFETARYMLHFEGVGADSMDSINRISINRHYTNMMNWMWLLLAICGANLFVYLVKCWRAIGITEAEANTSIMKTTFSDMFCEQWKKTKLQDGGIGSDVINNLFTVVTQFIKHAKLENLFIIMPSILKSPLDSLLILPNSLAKHFDIGDSEKWHPLWYIGYLIGGILVVLQLVLLFMPTVLFSGLNPNFLDYIKSNNQWISWLAYIPLIVILYMAYNLLEIITSTSSLGYIILDIVLILATALMVTISFRKPIQSEATDQMKASLSAYANNISTLEIELRYIISTWYHANGYVKSTNSASASSSSSASATSTSIPSKNIHYLRNAAHNTIANLDAPPKTVQGAQAFICLIDGLQNVGGKSDTEIASLFNDPTFTNSVFDVMASVPIPPATALSTHVPLKPIISKFLCYEPTHLDYMRKLGMDKIMAEVANQSPDTDLRDRMLSLIYMSAIIVSLFIYILFIVGAEYSIYYMSIITSVAVLAAALIYFLLYVLVIIPPEKSQIR